ncbi:conserved hypothetical protein, partial [Ricinus communis]
MECPACGTRVGARARAQGAQGTRGTQGSLMTGMTRRRGKCSCQGRSCQGRAAGRLEGMGQCLAEPVAQHLGLFGEGAQSRKVMDHAGVDLQVHGHAGGLQPLGIALSFVDQRVVLGQHHQRGCQPAQVGCLQGGKAPVLPVRIAAQVLAEHPGQGVTFQQMAGGQARMRVAVLLRCRAGVEQQLQQGLGHARVARGDAQGRGQRAPTLSPPWPGAARQAMAAA